MWHTKKGHQFVHPFSLQAYRIIEDQNRSTTRNIVDTAIEHEILENLIEKNKPNMIYYGDEAHFAGLHYLLFTPFRYPPLKRGSRFGNRFERNLFYGSLQLKTAMAEKAFYRFSFIRASQGKLSHHSIKLVAFSVHLKVSKGIDLSKEPFIAFRNQISSPVSYEVSQTLGEDMRKTGIEAFISYSARCPENGKNINVFTPAVFSKKEPLEKTFELWNCYSTQETIEFYSNTPASKSIIFKLENFMIDNTFPTI